MQPEASRPESVQWSMWLPTSHHLRLLDIGCGTAEEAGALLACGAVAEFVGVDLDEEAIAQARARWPQATFLCTDAAQLPCEYAGQFHVALLRRPDLLAQPRRWQRVFAALSNLLHPGGRAVVTTIGEGEAVTAREWLESSGLRVTHAERLSQATESHLLVAEVSPDASHPAEPFSLMSLDGETDEEMCCTPLSGECLLPLEE